MIKLVAPAVMVLALTAQASAQSSDARKAIAGPWAHPPAVCVISPKHGGGTCTPGNSYAQAGDSCSCKDFFGKKKPGTVTWAKKR